MGRGASFTRLTGRCQSLFALQSTTFPICLSLLSGSYVYTFLNLALTTTFLSGYLTYLPKALPIYHEMATSIFHYSRGDKQACLMSLKAIVGQLPALLRVFSKMLVETQISTKVWMQYVQGPTAWGAGEMINGEYIEYDGLSGSHATFFRVADAFLALAPYFSEENMRRYIPESQRKLFQAIQYHGFREKAKEAGDELIGVEIENMLKQLRVSVLQLYIYPHVCTKYISSL